MKVGDLVRYSKHRLGIIIAKRPEDELDAFIVKDIEAGYEQTLGREYLELL